MAPVAVVDQALNAFSPQFESAKHIYVAYSGGMDSHVLLHSMAKLVGSSRLTALHINHQLSPNAAQWAEHCRGICQSLGVNYLCRDVLVDTGGSRENAARQARYQAFEAQLSAGDILVLAHHADDQAETILYRLLRRSGPRGLAGMPVSRPLGAATLLRPLLGLEQVVLEDYARRNKLQWVEDESNQSRQFDRNFLRHEIIPQLKSRWPNYAARISDAGILCEQAEQINEELARLDLGDMGLRRERRGWSVEIPVLSALGRARQANVLRYLARLKVQSPPGHRVIDEVLGSLLNADENRNPLVHWSGGQWRRFQDRLHLLATDTVAQADDESVGDRGLPWSIEEALTLPDGSLLTATAVSGEGLAEGYAHRLSVSFRRGGERCRPAKRGGRANLKKLFQEFALEPWLRARIPLIYRDGELVAVGDLWVCEGYQAGADEPGYRLQWTYPSGCEAAML